MTPENQKIALAKFCGWRARVQGGVFGSKWFVWSRGIESAQLWQLPDYLNDLNAMSEAENLLTPEQLVVYRQHLQDMFSFSLHSPTPAITASAAQRAEALLKTIGEWK